MFERKIGRGFVSKLLLEHGCTRCNRWRAFDIDNKDAAAGSVLSVSDFG